jgi:hypothetical protein
MMRPHHQHAGTPAPMPTTPLFARVQRINLGEANAQQAPASLAEARVTPHSYTHRVPQHRVCAVSLNTIRHTQLCYAAHTHRGTLINHAQQVQSPASRLQVQPERDGNTALHACIWLSKLQVPTNRSHQQEPYQ